MPYGRGGALVEIGLTFSMKKVKVILRDRINKNTLWVKFAWCFDS